MYCDSYSRHIVRLVFGVVMAIGAGSLSGQIPGGMNETTKADLGGNTYVVGTVFAPGGRPINYRLRVKLVSPMRGEIISSTDARGQFLFSGVSAGQYSIVIDGEDGFEPYFQRLDVDTSRSPSPQVYTLTVRLSDRRKKEQKPAVIEAEDADASKKAVSLYKEALDRSRSDDHKGAIEKLKAAVADSPRYVSALTELGSEYMLAGQLEKAEAPLLKALEISPGAFAPAVNLGILQFRTNRFKDAAATLERAVAANGTSSVAHFYLGRTLYALGRTDDAIKALTDTLKLGDQFKEAHRLLAVLYLEKRDRAKVIEHLETYLKLVPDAKDAAELRSILKQARN